MRNFAHVSKDFIVVLDEFLQALRLKTIGYEPARKLPLAIKAVYDLPEIPENNFVVTLNYKDVSLYAIITKYKIEISDSINDGFESYTRFNYRYEAEGYTEQEGNLYELTDLLLNTLRNCSLEDISFKDEE